MLRVTKLNRQLVLYVSESQRHHLDVSYSTSHVVFCIVIWALFFFPMMVPNGNDDVTRQAYT